MPARVGAHLAVAGVREPDALEELRDQSLPLVAADSVERRLQPQVLAARQERVERSLLERGADRGTHLWALLRDVEPGDGRAAAGGREERRQHVDGRRLAGAVRAEEPVDLPGQDPKVDPRDRLHILELPPEPDRLDSLVAPAHSH